MASAPSDKCIDGTNNSRIVSAESALKEHTVQLEGASDSDCVFVEEPPKHLQTECSVCLCVLKEPCLLDCCGNRFCQGCIEPIKSEKRPCPLCNLPFTTSLLDKQLKRTLNSLYIYCPQKVVGCTWTGELGTLSQHLNVNCEDEIDARYNGCSFASLKCTHCKKDIQRQSIVKHETDQCPERPYSCDYCHDYASTCKDVTDNHWPMCPSRSVPCPNECGKYPTRNKLEKHLEDDCSLAVVSCTFSYAGCTIKLPRQDLSSHLTDDLSSHMSLQARYHQHQLKELQLEVKELKLDNQKLKSCLEQQSQQITAILGRPHVCRNVAQTPDSLVTSAAPHVASNDPAGRGSLIVFENFEQYTVWWSPPFYTHPQGYKVCLKVYPNTHVSVYINLMKGEFDNQLSWPLLGKFTIRLLKNSNMEYCEHVVVFHDRISPRVSGRVVKGDKSIEGFGVHKFIAHQSLVSQYIQNNSIRFSILHSIY